MTGTVPDLNPGDSGLARQSFKIHHTRNNLKYQWNHAEPCYHAEHAFYPRFHTSYLNYLPTLSLYGVRRPGRSVLPYPAGLNNVNLTRQRRVSSFSSPPPPSRPSTFHFLFLTEYFQFKRKCLAGIWPLPLILLTNINRLGY